LNSEYMLMLRVLLEWMIKIYMLNIFDIVVICCLNIINVEKDRVLYDNRNLFTLMQIKTSLVSCVPNVASFSFLIALSIFSNVHSLLIIALCWSFVDDMNSLFAFQTKYAKQNLVLKIIDAKRYALISNSP
jgi:hypothetical protein